MLHHQLEYASTVSILPALFVLFSVLLHIFSHKFGDSAADSVRCALQDNPSNTVDMAASRVNEKYCDCGDGAHEHSAATSLGNPFIALGEGHIRRSIHTSWLHHSHCDCFRGSDEENSTCTYTCPDLQHAMLQKVQTRIDAFKSEIARRETYVAQAFRVITDDKQCFSSLQLKLMSFDSTRKATDTQITALWSVRVRHVATDAPPARWKHVRRRGLPR